MMELKKKQQTMDHTQSVTSILEHSFWEMKKKKDGRKRSIAKRLFASSFVIKIRTNVGSVYDHFCTHARTTDEKHALEVIVSVGNYLRQGIYI
jgi:hypothetical protein